MRVIALIALSLLVPPPFLVGLTQPASLNDMIVEEAVIDSSDPSGNPKVMVRVRNQGQRTIVAWGVSASLTDSKGVVSNTGGGVDGHDWDVRVLPNNPVLLPGGIYTIRLAAPSLPEVISVKATPAYAIFEDNSAVGEERSIEMQFQMWARYATAWQFIEEVLEEAMPSATAPDGALRLVEAAIAAAPKEMRETFPCFEVAQRIRVALRGGSAQTAGALLQQLRNEIGVRRKAAASRSFRRQ